VKTLFGDSILLLQAQQNKPAVTAQTHTHIQKQPLKYYTKIFYGKLLGQTSTSTNQNKYDGAF